MIATTVLNLNVPWRRWCEGDAKGKVEVRARSVRSAELWPDYLMDLNQRNACSMTAAGSHFQFQRREVLQRYEFDIKCSKAKGLH